MTVQKRKVLELVMVLQACNTSTEEAETGGETPSIIQTGELCLEFMASLDYRGRPCLGKEERGWSDGTAVKSTPCSCRKPDLGSQHPNRVAHNYL